MAESLEEISPTYSIETPEFCLITVLEKGKSFPYTIPSFPVFTVMLREAKLQWEEDGTVEYFDGFIRECGLLEHPLPAVAKVYYGYKNAFPVEVLCASIMSLIVINDNYPLIIIDRRI